MFEASSSTQRSNSVQLISLPLMVVMATWVACLLCTANATADVGLPHSTIFEPLQPRRVQSVAGKPIIQLLTPSDQEVDLIAVRDVPKPIRGENGQLLPLFTESSDLIAVVQLVSTASRLTEDRSWVMSTVEVRLLEVLKGPSTSSSRYRQGGHVSFEWHGGTVDIGPHRVRARTLGVRGLSQSSRYLIFGTVTDNGRLILQPSTVYEVIGNDIRSMFDEQFGAMDDVDAADLPTVKQRITALLKARRQ